MEDLHTRALNMMKLFISLAQIDGAIVETEKHFLVKIGKANGLTATQLEPLFERSHKLIIPAELSDNERFQYLLTMVQLVKVDEKMYPEEFLFCSKIAQNIGYDAQVLFDFLLEAKEGMSDDQVNDLKQRAQKYRTGN